MKYNYKLGKNKKGGANNPSGAVSANANIKKVLPASANNPVNSPNNLGKGPNNLGKGPNNLGKGPSNLGKGPNNLGKGPNNLGKGPSNQVNSSNKNNSPILSGVSRLGKNSLTTLGEKTSNVVEKASAESKVLAGKVYKKTLEFDTKWLEKTLIVIIFITILIGLVYLFYIGIKNIIIKREISTLLVPGTIKGNQAITISQTPNQQNFIPIPRSENQSGIEFTYGLWIWIDNLESTSSNRNQTIFYKGTPNNFYPDVAPGLFLMSGENKLEVRMSTMDNNIATFEVPDIPIQKWLCINIVLKPKKSSDDGYTDPNISDKTHVINVYINGKNKKSYLLESPPKQNDREIYVCTDNGFNGYLSKLTYFSKALDSSEIKSFNRNTPSSIQVAYTSELPPYLDSQWWY